MLIELWRYLRTPVAFPFLRPMGFVKESIAMQARYKRCRKTWNFHYRQCRQAIETAVSHCVSTRTLVVLGAGSLQDLPLDFLAGKFQKIKLVDLLFLEDARQKAAAYSNIELIELDISYSLQNLYQGSPVVSKADFALRDMDVDLVLSMNLLTQLPLLPVSWLRKKFQFAASDLDRVAQSLINHHLSYLQNFACPVCLIADRSIKSFDRHGKEIDRIDPWWGIKPLRAEKEWDWELAPIGEINNNSCRVHCVGVSFLNLPT
ncbi:MULTISPECIES: hypothetical protein [Thiomicrorhabdus]|uniref:Class I SAM-dependent methyltransferase n=1 Tax=Thiomicrorhabdus heinhorstiae TaxID=2748010 RepID=A0ABS0BW30_9GAMM|nr:MULTISPECIES: hypothetical protein [Thiomicrorhabdus]MBF6058020.1 hypothetical protein [Thiomicrorhabdus heinhorstiae]